MFGLSWAQIIIIVLVGVFVLGPERIPTAVTWVLGMLRKARTMAAGAQAELRREIGPELEELRRQVADLQSLKEIQDLRDLRDLHPKRLIGKNILGDEFSGGFSGFLGLGQQQEAASVAQNDPDPEPAFSTTEPDADPAIEAGATAPPHLPPSMAKLAAPKVVGGTVGRGGMNAAQRPTVLAAGERPPFDPDGT